jgi:hypothetical protein
VSSLKSITKAKAASSKTGNKKKDLAEIGKGPRKNSGDFAWKDVAPKKGDPRSKVVKGKTYHWCTHHTTPLWTLHNPDSFPNLCRYNPKYAELEKAFSGGAGDSDGDKEPTAADMKLADALAAIQESDEEEDDG